MRLRRRPFAELVDTQLDLLAEEHAELVAACADALRAYDAAAADEAEQRYGEYADHADALASALASARDAYARTLDARAEAAYRRTFEARARRRFPRAGPELD